MCCHRNLPFHLVQTVFGVAVIVFAAVVDWGSRSTKKMP